MYTYKGGKGMFKKMYVVVIIMLFIGGIFVPSTISIELSENSENNGSLSGHITDIEMKPIDSAKVTISCGDITYECFSNDTGYYCQENIPIVDCFWNITVFKFGFNISYVDITIEENTIYDFILTPRIGIFIDDDSQYPGEGTIDNPFHFIWQGIENSSNGDTIFVLNGTYYENLLINKSIKLIGENRNITNINGNITNNAVKIESDNVTIKDFNFKSDNIFCKTGIYINQHKYITINDNIFSGHFDIDLNVRFCYNIKINNNIFENGKQANIQLYATDKVLVENNCFKSSTNEWSHGIKLIVCNNDNIVNNTFTDAYRKYIYLESSENNIIFNNTFQLLNFEEEDWIDCFINLTGSNNNWITNNSIHLSRCNNNLPKVHFSIRMKNSNDNGIYNNSIISDSKIYSSAIEKFEGYGIYFSSSNGNFLKNNYIYQFKVGVAFTQAKGNRLKFNNISSCTQYGLWMSRTTYNLIINNTFWKNKQTAWFYLALHDWLWLNDFHPSDKIIIIKSDWFQGSIIWGQFNYWGNEDLGHWAFKINYIPYILFSPALRQPHQNSSLADFGWYLLTHWTKWKEEVYF